MGVNSNEILFSYYHVIMVLLHCCLSDLVQNDPVPWSKLETRLSKGLRVQDKTETLELSPRETSVQCYVSFVFLG